MSDMDRCLMKWLKELHPPDKMVFLAGPRQVGKTTMVKQILETWHDKGAYFNWDISSHRRRILEDEDLLAEWRRPAKRPMIIFDELHKMRQFKSWLKGFYDEYRDDASVWVTGSGRLDLYRKGGDSLLGRYFLYRMHPLSIGEIQKIGQAGSLEEPDKGWEAFAHGEIKFEDMDSLFNLGGFPEPYLKQESTFHRRWLRSRRERITHEDVRDLTRIDDVDRLEYLIRLLNPRIASPLSLNSLRGDLGIAFETVRGWIATLERLYYIYGVTPYSHRLQRAIKCKKKYYFWDWSEVQDEAARFENFVMSHLLKACHIWSDFGLGDFKLWYLRDREKREVDFVLVKDNHPVCLFETKESYSNISKAGRFYGNKLNIPFYQIVRNASKVETFPGNCFVIPASNFLMLTG